MEFTIPRSMKQEHDELHQELKALTAGKSKVAAAARKVADALHAHFEKEEAFALPPLGALPQLARGEVTADLAGLLPMTDRLKAELPQMLKEHQAIVASLRGLMEAGKKARKPSVLEFATKLMRHAQNEEEVSYPTSILIGEYVHLKLGR